MINVSIFPPLSSEHCSFPTQILEHDALHYFSEAQHCKTINCRSNEASGEKSAMTGVILD